MAKEKLEVTGKVVAKAGKGEGFRIENVDGWLNAKYAAADFKKVEKGVVVKVTYTENGNFKNVSKIEVVSAAPAPAPSETKTDAPKVTEPPAPGPQSGTKYGSAEDITGKEVGCAVGVAGTLLAGIGVNEEDDEKIMERFRKVSKEVLDHMRTLKQL